MNIGNKIKELRIKKGMSQEKLARLVGYAGRSTINKIELNKRHIPRDKICMFAEVLGVSPTWLMGWEDNSEPNHKETLDKDDKPEAVVAISVDTVELPILGDVAAGRVGNYSDIVTYSDNTQRVPMDWMSDGQEYILMRVKGDSMEPRFEENDLLFARFQTSVDSGSFAIVWVEDEGGLIKKIVYGEDWIELHSLNPTYPVRRFEGADVMQVRVVGLVKKSIRNY